MSTSVRPDAIERNWNLYVHRVREKWRRAMRICEVAREVSLRAGRRQSVEGIRRAERLVRRAESLRKSAIEELREAVNILPAPMRDALIDQLVPEEREFFRNGGS